MAKVTKQNIKDLGFNNPDLWELADDATLDSMIDAVISEVSATLQGQIGSTAYSATTEPNKGRVKKAEECLVAAELLLRRINKILKNIQGAGQEISTKAEREQMKAYRDRADDLIMTLLADTDTGFGSGVVTSSHFGS